MIISRLNKLARKLVIPRKHLERSKIKASLKNLEKKINAHFDTKVSKLIYFGSWTRNTLLPRKYDPSSDIDLMVVFNTDNKELLPVTYRNQLKSFLEQNYPRNFCKKDLPVVRLELNHIKIELVPAINGYAYDNRLFYDIPKNQEYWQETEPNDLNAELTQANQYYGRNLVRSILRLMKYWNASHNYPWESYLLEKEIVDLNFRGEDIYSGFLYALNEVGANIPKVRQALDWIENYQSKNDREKELLWMRKLLPEL